MYAKALLAGIVHGVVVHITISLPSSSLTLDDLIDAVKSEHGPQEFDNSCFNCEYVTGDISSEYLDSLEMNRNENTKHTINSDESIGLHNQA